MKILTLLVTGVFTFVLPAAGQADEVSHRAAAESLLELTQVEQLMSQSRDQLLELQVKQNPALAPHERQLRAFFAKYLSWDRLKPDLIKIYMAEFAEADLREMIAFYRTPAGRKAIQKMPALVAQTAEVSRAQMRRHLPELQQMLEAASSSAPDDSPGARK